MSDIYYSVVTEVYAGRVAYGIAAFSDVDADGFVTMLASAHDLTENKERINDLAARCNSEDLSLVHFWDVVEDFIGGCLMKKSPKNPRIF